LSGILLAMAVTGGAFWPRQLMTDELPRRSVVILSTTPPIPRDYGNRNRVFQTLSLFRKLNFETSFLLYPLDRDWASGIPIYYKELVGSFEFFSVIPNSKPLHQPARGYHHDIDEWWDDNIAQSLGWLFARRRFDVFLVNYTFLSKAFDYAPKSTLKILDTHDLFSGRREIFEKNGVAAEFFYTNQQQESIGFNRADLIIAIKQSEQQTIQAMTEKPVVCLPYWDDRSVTRRDPRTGTHNFDHERPLRIGFIGAHNSVNIINVGRFLETFALYARLYNLPVEVLIAGNVCDGIDRQYPFLRKIGFVDDIAEFYEHVDVIVAPLEFSTGIKIKVGEALARGVPVVATRNAFDGFRAYHSIQSLPDLASLCEAIACIACGELPWAEVATAGQKAAITAARAQDNAFAIIGDHVVAALRRLLVIVDRPFWYRETFIDEMISQSIELLSQITPVIVCYICEEMVVTQHICAKADYVRITACDELLAKLRDVVFANYNVAETVIIACAPQTERAVLSHLRGFEVTTWSLGLAHSGINTKAVLHNTIGSQDIIELAPLRYLPSSWPADLRNRDHVSLFVAESGDEWAELARDYVELVAADFGLAVHTIAVPPYHEFDAKFYKLVRDRIGGKSILICENFYPTFIIQTLTLARVPFLLIHPDFICPELMESSKMPSLEGSLSAFLDRKHWARALTGPDTGWSAVFRQLSTPFKVHSASRTKELAAEELTADDSGAFSDRLKLGESDLAGDELHAAPAVQVEQF
jgi:glycosyltransferase involved in cell wall biosynthesis